MRIFSPILTLIVFNTRKNKIIYHCTVRDTIKTTENGSDVQVMAQQ